MVVTTSGQVADRVACDPTCPGSKTPAAGPPNGTGGIKDFRCQRAGIHHVAVLDAQQFRRGVLLLEHVDAGDPVPSRHTGKTPHF